MAHKKSLQQAYREAALGLLLQFDKDGNPIVPSTGPPAPAQQVRRSSWNEV